MKRFSSAEELNDFWCSFTNYGFVGGNHIVQWNQNFAIQDEERFIRVFKTVLWHVMDTDLTADFNSILLYYNKGDLALYIRIVNAYTAWFYTTLQNLLDKLKKPEVSPDAT
ncbi:hypothetical protein [Larkinella terrae]|uniref:Uncharacterized protein n=1 Tax=Larkinella terrae TaxID=2025311 RepID=A0A7K0ESM1_9BACT|nr:hypothetical protein [Larkinella terrae]MRS64810.1 hypothetical protein [Larkinella terrae]